MPLSKDAALSEAQKRDERPYNDLCAAIDEKIRKEFSPGSMVAVDVRGIPRHLVMRAVTAYEAAGWDARFSSDQRSGDYIIVLG